MYVYVYMDIYVYQQYVYTIYNIHTYIYTKKAIFIATVCRIPRLSHAGGMRSQRASMRLHQGAKCILLHLDGSAARCSSGASHRCGGIQLVMGLPRAVAEWFISGKIPI